MLLVMVKRVQIFLVPEVIHSRDALAAENDHEEAHDDQEDYEREFQLFVGVIATAVGTN